MAWWMSSFRCHARLEHLGRVSTVLKRNPSGDPEWDEPPGSGLGSGPARVRTRYLMQVTGAGLASPVTSSQRIYLFCFFTFFAFKNENYDS